MNKNFASLHNHSCFSLMDGIPFPEEVVVAAKEKNLQSIALTEHGNMHSLAQFYNAGLKHDVKTVIGMEAYVIGDLNAWNQARESALAKKKSKEEIDEEELKLETKSLKKKGHLVLLAKNAQGLSDLYNLSYLAHRDGFYGKPRADKEMLAKFGQHLYASTACMGGIIANKCWEFKREDITWAEVIKTAEEYAEIFPIKHFFLELQFNQEPGQAFINECMVKISQATGIPLTVTTDSHYIKPEDWEVQDVLYMLRSKPVKTFGTRGETWQGPVPGLYIKSAAEMWDSYLAYGKNLDPLIVEQAFENTLLIDSGIERYKIDTRPRLPSLPFVNPLKELVDRAFTALQQRGLHQKENYVRRLQHELKIIRDKGFANYFLITQDIVRKAKEKMCVGPGRGSGAGSLLCYVLNITDLDPIEHGLLFERFYNQDRTDPPDLDCDFENPEEVKEMLREQFGKDNVACLSTFHTFNVKGLLKDLGRIYDLNHQIMDGLTGKIEQEIGNLKGADGGVLAELPIELALDTSKTLNTFLKENPLIERHFRELYGKNRHLGRHAAGVVIGDNLPAQTPIVVSKDTVQTSFTEGIANKDLSAMGLIKFDILSIATLKVINCALKLIAQTTGKDYQEIKEAIRPHNLNLNDEKVFKHVFWDSNFVGIFQYANAGIQRLAQELKPDCFTDLVALGAIYRPGPLSSNMDKMFIAGKHHPESIQYDHPILEKILKETAGCLIFQEQVLAIGNQLGKLTLAEAEKLRKLISKKQKGDGLKALEDFKVKFIAGCQTNDFPAEKAEKLWEMLARFSGYGFNKSHAACYAVNTFQTAWLATYFPAQFYTAVLTCAEAAEKQEYVDGMKRLGLNILPIDVNHSKGETVIESTGIRLAFNLVKGVGESVLPKLIAGQPYADPLDFLQRSGATKTAILPLVRVGALSALDPNLKRLETRFNAFYEHATKFKSKKGWEGYLEIYNCPKMINIEDYSIVEKMAFEQELLGFNLAGDPFHVLNRQEKLKVVNKLCPLTYEEFLESDEESTIFPVVVKAIKERAQKNKQMMAFCRFGLANGREFEAPCFAYQWKRMTGKLQIGNIYLINFERDLEKNRLGLRVKEYGYNLDEITLH